MKIVCLESPFKPSEADVAKYEGRYTRADLLRQNINYARLALLNALSRGEAPFASHLLYTQVWSESADLRDAGIKAGIEAHQVCHTVALYVDLGISKGMQLAADHASLIGVEQARRLILDTAGKDVRDVLAALTPNPLPCFAYLEELEAAERGSVGRIRLGNGS